MSTKKHIKTTDPYVGVLLVVPRSKRDRWKDEAHSSGVSLTEWAIRQLGKTRGDR